ncbi:unnamed protein product [Linum tenue]|uniref:Peptidase A1 domain-containing protein n=1 Tax=Linum tenue TaxID=586396 RepID=A0AAV0J7S3_9ROSI|nr:unnamed protein product [Linum tenue]
MAWARPHRHSLLLLFLVFFYSCAANPTARAPLSSTVLYDSDHRPYSANASTVLVGPAGPAMILPLFHHITKKSQSASSSSGMLSNAKHRKNLQKSPIAHSLPHARMGLYDDLLLDGYYTTQLWIGTPPQKFSLIVDTGSTVTYVPCSTCEQCGNHEDPKFAPELSLTYEPMKCTMECNCDVENVFCTYERQYAEMSTSSGVLGGDLFSFGNDSGLDPQRAVFGCENVETGDLYTQHADGIMGLGRGDLSVVDQLVDKGVINDSFALCYGGMEVGGGAMVLGSISPPPDMVFTGSDPLRSPYYNVDLKEIHVAGKKLQLDPKIFNGKYGTVLDSGTTYAYLPEQAFSVFKDAIMKELHSLKRIHGPDPNYNDICFAGASSNVSELSRTFPKVELAFEKGQKILLSPENYLFRHSKVNGAYCLGVFQNGKDPTTLLGGIIARNTLVVYDRENAKVGFWKTNCSELWERLQLATSSPAPSPQPSRQNNHTEEASSVLAPSPSDLPHYALRGGIYIGRIEFEMSFSVNYHDLKKNLHNLTEHIAQELKINVSQVHVESLSPEGNDSLVGLSIVPLESTQYISNGTALSIIARVAKHQMNLPDSFGTYKLVQWKVQPPPQQTWWETHYLVILIAAISTLIVGLFGIGLWLVLRRRQNALTTYKSVDEDDDAPEQELQPLQ